MSTGHRFAPPWSVDEQEACFVVRDQNGRRLKSAAPMQIAQELKEPEGAVGFRLLSELPARFSTELFAGAELVRLRTGRVLFRAGDSGNGCYRVRTPQGHDGFKLRRRAHSCLPQQGRHRW